MRVAVGPLWQESNDLSTSPTVAADWTANGVLHGAHIEALAGHNALEAADRERHRPALEGKRG